jgi:hypothetical protein
MGAAAPRRGTRLRRAGVAADVRLQVPAPVLIEDGEHRDELAVDVGRSPILVQAPVAADDDRPDQACVGLARLVDVRVIHPDASAS